MILLCISLTSMVSFAEISEIINQCNDCHGKEGLSSESDIPIIAGQSVYLIEDALLAFAEKERPCKLSEYRHGDRSRQKISMCDIAKKLSDDEKTELSQHYGDLPFVGVKQDYDSTFIEKGATIHERHCEKCHSQGGTLADDDAGILAGQWTPYLRSSIKKFLAQQRPMADKMAKKINRLKPEDFEALFSFYASNKQADE